MISTIESIKNEKDRGEDEEQHTFLGLLLEDSSHSCSSRGRLISGNSKFSSPNTVVKTNINK